MEPEDNLNYPRYGQYGDTKRTDDEVCMWCGKNEVTWQLSRLTCSHRCHAALFLDTYKQLRMIAAVIPVLSVLVIIFVDYFLVAILMSIVVILMLGFFVYSSWMVRVGSIMREKSSTLQ